MNTNRLAIYLHIPFCRAKCHYCDFASYPGMDDLREGYVAALSEETRRWMARLGSGTRAGSIYLGGGTPTLLEGHHFARLMAVLPPLLPDAEVTVEANPATVTADSLRELRALGINRVSLGVQSFDDALLRTLGRQHDGAAAVASYELARRAGFDNVSIDLIFGLPGQDSGQWDATLRRAVALAPEHLALYGLTIEEDTAFGGLHRAGRLSVPDEDAQADMYLRAGDLLGAAGYAHYEISNWAARRDGEARCARHNLVYWRNEPYLGLGAAAHSFFDGRRFANTPDVRAYITRIDEGRWPVIASEDVDREQEMAETMMMGLRLAEGVSCRRFLERFGCRLEERYGATIAELRDWGLLAVSGEGIALSPRGRLLGNEVFARFLDG